MKKDGCTVSLVTYHNSPELVLNAIQSCLSSSLCDKVYVIDNSRTSALQTALQHELIEYHFTGKNLGFGRAHNVAILKKPLSKYHLILNPDVSFGPETLDALMDYMDSQQDIGLTIPKVLSQDGQMQYLCRRLLPTPWILIGRRFMPTFLKKRWQDKFDQYELKDRDPNEIMDVPCISGCFMLVRSKILTEIGGFDERFFMYLEDVDLCRRIGQKSRIVYYPKVEICHGWSRASYRNIKLMRMHMTSAIKYFNKWGWHS